MRQKIKEISVKHQHKLETALRQEAESGWYYHKAEPLFTRKQKPDRLQGYYSDIYL